MQRLFASLMAWAFLVLAIAMPMQSYARSTLVVQSVIELTAPPGLVAVQKQDAAVRLEDPGAAGSPPPSNA